jgi:hypothetical protein
LLRSPPCSPNPSIPATPHFPASARIKARRHPSLPIPTPRPAPSIKQPNATHLHLPSPPSPPTPARSRRAPTPLTAPTSSPRPSLPGPPLSPTPRARTPSRRPATAPLRRVRPSLWLPRRLHVRAHAPQYHPTHTRIPTMRTAATMATRTRSTRPSRSLSRTAATYRIPFPAPSSARRWPHGRDPGRAHGRRGDEVERSYAQTMFQLLHHGCEYVEEE